MRVCIFVCFSVFMWMYFCLFVCICMYFCLFVCLYLYVFLSVCLSLFVYDSVCLSVCICMYLFVCLYLYVFLSVCLSVYKSIYFRWSKASRKVGPILKDFCIGITRYLDLSLSEGKLNKDGNIHKSNTQHISNKWTLIKIVFIVGFIGT